MVALAATGLFGKRVEPFFKFRFEPMLSMVR